MKIGIMSDLHMEFSPWEFKPEKDVFYICAGDIDSSTYRRNMFCIDHYDYMFAIRGNHDYYNDIFEPNEMSIRETKGLVISGATLWTDLSHNVDWYRYIKSLVDYRYIHGLNQEAYNKAHNEQKKFLLNDNIKADIIVSHHCPSYRSVNEKYANDPLNNCFATELSHEILNMKNPPKLWIHGHTHEEFDYMIGDTRVICHPRGYPKEQPWYSTYEPKIVEI